MDVDITFSSNDKRPNFVDIIKDDMFKTIKGIDIKYNKLPKNTLLIHIKHKNKKIHKMINELALFPSDVTGVIYQYVSETLRFEYQLIFTNALLWSINANCHIKIHIFGEFEGEFIQCMYNQFVSVFPYLENSYYNDLDNFNMSFIEEVYYAEDDYNSDDSDKEDYHINFLNFYVKKYFEKQKYLESQIDVNGLYLKPSTESKYYYIIENDKCTIKNNKGNRFEITIINEYHLILCIRIMKLLENEFEQISKQMYDTFKTKIFRTNNTL
jgi:hypothetical protein